MTKAKSFMAAILAGVSVVALGAPTMAQTAEETRKSPTSPISSAPTMWKGNSGYEETGAEEAQGVDVIVVTAQRREENLQEVPISVTAVTNEALEAKGIENTLDLAQVVPGLSLTSTAGSTQVKVRGVGTTNFGPGVENPVAIYVDGVYIASTAAALFNLSNIERVEVLKGPQGTLFGRNATGGLVQIVLPEPSYTLTGMVEAGYGNYDTITGDLYVSGPISDSLAADFTVHYQNEGDGWGTNLNTGNDNNRIKHDLIARSSLMFEPSDDLKLILAGDYSYLLGSRPVTLLEREGFQGLYEQALGPVDEGGFYDSNSTVDPRAEITSWGVSLTGTIGLGNADLKSITAYRRTRFEDRFDIERVPFDILTFDGVPKWRQFSQELQLTGDTGPLQYTAGAYYFNSRDEYEPFGLRFGPDAVTAGLIPPALGPGIIVNSANLQFDNAVETESIAGYAQATYEILPETNFTLGGRYTSEQKDLSGTRQFIFSTSIGEIPAVPPGTPYAIPSIDPSVSYDNFSYRIALDHKFTPDILGYLSYATGFKSGGYNLTEPTNPAYDPETIKALEAGLKMELFDRNLRLNLSAFHYDYSNIQVSNFIATAPFIVNAAKAKIDGVEAEFDARLADGFTLSGGVAYTDARFSEFPNADFTFVTPDCVPTGNPGIPCKADAAGNRLPSTPKFTANIGFGYEGDLGDNGLFGINANLFHSSGFFGTFDNDPRLFQDDYQVLNASIYFEPNANGLRFTLWGKNLLDQQYVRNYYISAQQPTYQAAAPLTYGISVEQQF